jgi:poly-gamma-glutamate capsule biosynthesis protein CapA/YwtB (metallophosphatase superfamily)
MIFRISLYKIIAMKVLFGLIFTLLLSVSYSQDKTDSTKHDLSLLFIGDIMGHGPQITAAYDKTSKTYNYTSVFKYVSPQISSADFCMANLEVTLAGPPFKGYPQFSSPDEIAVACKESGIDAIVTSNNHSCDRGDKGVIRTINVLDSIGILHTGTFKDSADRKKNNPLIIEQNCMRIAFLNYTYGTNGLKDHYPAMVNRLDKDVIKADIAAAQKLSVDKIIVVTHWGLEYKPQPDSKDVEMGKFIFEAGADIIIGSHPHVLQKMIWEKKTDIKTKEEVIVYSLGNFVSNQRARYKDGGAMFQLTLQKVNGEVSIKSTGYYLTWVYTPYKGDVKQYHILPAAWYENNPAFFDNKESYNKMKLFLSDSRALYGKYNVNVPEILPSVEE